MLSLFDAVTMAPPDPIVGVTDRFLVDPNPAKINLSVGVYLDEHGQLPLLRCVGAAEEMVASASSPHGYLPIDGMAAYCAAMQDLAFGDAPAREEGRVLTVQAVGGTGAIKVGADVLHRISPAARVLISQPSWENHRAIFEGAGFDVETYAYYDPVLHRVDFAAMRASLTAAAPGTIVVLHACCHNPTGCDLTPAEWTEVVELLRVGSLVPFLDMAYQGFGDGVTEDRRAVELCLAAGLDFFVATSCSKSFSLYGERVGALSVACSTRDVAARVLSQVRRVIRANYSSPPTHGAAVIVKVLSTPALRMMWEEELASMRDRITRVRAVLEQKLVDAGASMDTSFISQQHGMFSYSGLSRAQMERLRNEFGIYGLDSGRLCVAAINGDNIDAVAKAIALVTQSTGSEKSLIG